MRAHGYLGVGALARGVATIASILTALSLHSSPLLAQDLSDDIDEEESEEAEFALDLTLPDRSDTATVDPQCQAQMDSARITGEIIVCRTLGDLTDGAWNQRAWERDYAERTQGPKNPNVDRSGLILPTEGSIFMVTFTAKFGQVSERPVIVDFEALPKAPSGSDADRIARGLPPLGKD